MAEHTLEVLCATMHQHDFQKLQQMNISSDVIFANQTDVTRYDEMVFQDGRARMISTQTRGVGRNRNLALTYAEGDILLFSDDDICYADDYKTQVLEAFRIHPDADMIVFSMDIVAGGKRIRQVLAPDKRLHIWNSLRYGTSVLSIRRESQQRANLWFSVLFGGGTEHAHGEDTIFLTEVFRKKLKVYGSSYCLGTCSKDYSTCFSGFDRRYFFDQGVVYAAVFGPLAWAAALRFCIKRRKKYARELSFRAAFHAVMEGIRAERTRE